MPSKPDKPKSSGKPSKLNKPSASSPVRLRQRRMKPYKQRSEPGKPPLPLPLSARDV